jgi:hypothetical protein
MWFDQIAYTFTLDIVLVPPSSLVPLSNFNNAFHALASFQLWLLFQMGVQIDLFQFVPLLF